MLVTAVVALGLLVPSPAIAHEAAGDVAAPTIVPFEDWAPSSCPRPTGADVATTQRVVVHHSHQPTAATREDVRPALAEICRIHVARGFDTIGYHYVVDPWGTVWQARGRMPDDGGHAPVTQPEGAHVHGGNPGATGVVFLGDHEDTPPTAAAVDAAVGLLAWLVEATDRDPAQLVTIETTGAGTSLVAGLVEVEVLAGHSATNATLCPGRHLIALLGPIRDRVRAVIAAAGQPPAPLGILSVSPLVQPAPEPGTAHLATSTPVRPAPPVGTAPGTAGAVHPEHGFTATHTPGTPQRTLVDISGSSVGARAPGNLPGDMLLVAAVGVLTLRRRLVPAANRRRDRDHASD